MLKGIAYLCLTVFACNGVVLPGWDETAMIFSDEFNGPAGSAVDAEKWRPATGGSGWGNNELQFYTGGAANARLDGNGHLSIEARRSPPSRELSCWYGNCRFTSARLTTKQTFAARYGRFEASIRFPEGKGLWPAFWLLGSDIDKISWPECGEIDIVEMLGDDPKLVHGTLHGPGYSGGNGIGKRFRKRGSLDFSKGFHTFGLEWRPESIKWYVDGKMYHSVKPSKLPAGKKWVFDHPFFIILNLAVGGNWPGSPDAKTVFPGRMLVDYVRVYGIAPEAGRIGPPQRLVPDERGVGNRR